MERNHKVQVEDIFVRRHGDECGHSVSFYQVVRLKGKTMAEISEIECKFVIDESCDEARSQCRVFPKKDAFYEKTAILSVRALTDEEDGENCLRTIEKDRYMREWLFPYKENHMYHISGYDGRYIIEKYGLTRE